MVGSWASILFEPPGLVWLFAFVTSSPILAVYIHFLIFFPIYCSFKFLIDQAL
jgi:hypothetical protein